MKYYYNGTAYCWKRKNKLTFNMDFISEGGRVALVFGVVMEGLDDIRITWCHKNHFLKRLTGFIEEEEYKDYIEEVRQRSNEFYKKYYKEL